MNTIGRIKFDFRMQSEQFAQSLYADWDRFFSSSFEKVANDLLKRYDIDSDTLEIDTLQLDIGTLTESDFYELFPIRLKDVMEENLQKCLYYSKSDKNKPEMIRRHPVQKSPFELLCYFLLHGTLPWYASSGDIAISDLFLQVIKNDPDELKKFLQLYGHYTSLQQRLVYQLNDPALEEGVRMIRSADSTFICSYVRYLREKYNHLEQPQITETNYRYAVWQVIYSWMLTDRSSSFDKKNFLRRTITGLAAHINMAYLTLLTLLTWDIDSLTHQPIQLPELLRLLAALRDESVRQLRKEKLQGLPDLFDLLGNTRQKEIEKILTSPSFSPEFLAEWLIPLLSNADSCRSFLLHLKEDEIIRLIQIVIPEEAEFITGYARSLDKQKEQGVLQGKAGSEFTRMKWMVIFPVLIENRGAGFNRKYFVRKVLQSVAARYNLSVMDLLTYFMHQEMIGKLDPSLLSILEAFYAETKKTFRSVTEKERNGIPVLLHKLSQNDPFTGEDRTTLYRIWSQPQEALNFIRSLPEKGYYALIMAITPEEQPFVMQYAAFLDRYRQGLLEGKTSGDFRYIKWYFILRVLMDKKGAAINRRHLTATVLRDLAARYNLSYFELIHYFYTQVRLAPLPPALTVILRELYQKEQRLQINTLLTVSGEEKRYELLEKLYPDQTPFIRSFLRLINTASFRLNIGTDSSYSRLLWENIFLILTEFTGRQFSRQTCFVRLLQLLASHYKIKTEILYKQLSNAIRQGTTVPPDLKQIIMSQSNHWDDLDFIQSNNSANNQNSPDAYYVHNAGMVLIVPFCTRLFSLLRLVDQGEFINDEAKVRAIFILQYAVFGNQMKDEYPEYELILNKIIVGYKANKTLPLRLKLTDEEKKMTDDMLNGALKHWEKLSRSSVATIQQAFFQRSGALKVEDDRYLLTIDEKAYDMLLDSLPWNYKMIRYPWMEKRLEVKWR